MRVGRPIVSSLGIVAAGLFLVVGTALACYPPNEGAAAGDDVTNAGAYIHYGWKGETDLHLASPHADSAIIHPAQVATLAWLFVL